MLAASRRAHWVATNTNAIASAGVALRAQSWRNGNSSTRRDASNSELPDVGKFHTRSACERLTARGPKGAIRLEHTPRWRLRLPLECDAMPSRETIEEKLGRVPGVPQSDDHDDMTAETAADKF